MLGVLFALAQHDLKRLLAYHSVENIGIILLGIGLGVLGLAERHAARSRSIGFAAGLLHVLNHSIFKGLLFLGAGAVQHGAHSLDFEELGGLLKRMPWTGAAFLIGAAGDRRSAAAQRLRQRVPAVLCGLSRGRANPRRAPRRPAWSRSLSMGLISGLAAACFAKAFGIVFLGSPRTAEAGTAHEAAPPMRAAMAVLALLCVAIGSGGAGMRSAFVARRADGRRPGCRPATARAAARAGDRHR